MSAKVDREGTFRGRILEYGVATTKNGFPQFTARLRVVEMYDDEAGEWIDWKDFDEMEALGFFTLFGGKGETFHVEALERALGWTDGSFVTLGAGEWVDKVVQFRVQESTQPEYPGLQVKTIDAFDADPVRSLRQLDVSELKNLDQKYVIQRKAKKPLPVSAAPTTGKKPPPRKKGAPKNCTKLEAWTYITENRGEHSDDELAEGWKAGFIKVCGTKDEDEATPKEWAQIRDEIMKDLNLTPAA